MGVSEYPPCRGFFDVGCRIVKRLISTGSVYSSYAQEHSWEILLQTPRRWSTHSTYLTHFYEQQFSQLNISVIKEIWSLTLNTMISFGISTTNSQVTINREKISLLHLLFVRIFPNCNGTKLIKIICSCWRTLWCSDLGQSCVTSAQHVRDWSLVGPTNWCIFNDLVRSKSSSPLHQPILVFRRAPKNQSPWNVYRSIKK